VRKTKQSVKDIIKEYEKEYLILELYQITKSRKIRPGEEKKINKKLEETENNNGLLLTHIENNNILYVNEPGEKELKTER